MTSVYGKSGGMEDRYRVQSAGKEPWGAGARASGVRPNSSLPGGVRILALPGRGCLPGAVTQRGLFGSQQGAPGGAVVQWRTPGRRAVSRMLPGPGRRVYVCVHGGEVQGVCTARAGRAPVRPPSSAAIQGQRRRVKIPRKTLAREPRGAGWGTSGRARPGPHLAAELANAKSQHPQTRKQAA